VRVIEAGLPGDFTLRYLVAKTAALYSSTQRDWVQHRPRCWVLTEEESERVSNVLSEDFYGRAVPTASIMSAIKSKGGFEFNGVLLHCTQI
jgi:hypothetical protein